jgi:hypothetical protein
MYKANETRENKGEAGTTLICPDCHLEEANTREPNDAAQAAIDKVELPDKKTIYNAFKDSPGLKNITGRHPSDKAIKKVIERRKTINQSVRELVDKYDCTLLIASLRVLLGEKVFTSYDAAKRRFPDLFPEEQVSNCEEGQETATKHLSTKEFKRLDGKYNQSSEVASGFGGNHSSPHLGEPVMY